MKIGIYGGSFNPIHKGHIEVAKNAIKELDLDNLYFVPAFKSPFKSKEKYADVEHRVNMIELIKEDKMKVSLFEVNRKGSSYTIDTIKYFKTKYPNDELYLIIGSDNLYKLNKWKSIDEIASSSNIVVFKRKGDFSRLNVKKYNCTLLKNELFDYSSSEFKKGNFSQIPEAVNKYIAKNFLYVSEILANMNDAKRHKHSIATGSLAAKYAKEVNFDAKRAWFAGTMHDITKNMSIDWHRGFLEKNGIDDSKIENHELHSLTAYYWLKNEYMIEDAEILNSIKRHTNLDKDLDILDKVVYAADKLSEGRKFEGIQDLRKTILKDFEKGFKEIVKINYKGLEASKKLSDKQKEIYEGLI